MTNKLDGLLYIYIYILPFGVLYFIPRMYNSASVSARVSLSEPLPSNMDAAKLRAKKRDDQ